MNVLIACEESQEICKAFRAKGHNAFSCDLQPCSGGHPEWHLNCNVETILKPNFHVDGWFTGIVVRTQTAAKYFIPKWDLIIARPPGTYLSNAGARWLWAGHKLNIERYEKGLDARAFFMKLWHADCPCICIENPVPSSIYFLPAYSQVVQPYEYGHPYSKKTCLWLKGLPLLKPTDIVADHIPFISSGTYSKTHDPKYKGASRKGESSKSRSKTFPGIARAMAEQWG